MKNPNYTYGVDTNDHDAIKRAYRKLKRKHILITFLAILAIAFLGIFVYDFYLLNSGVGIPILASKERVDNGYVYKSIGYKALYCDNGEKYIGSVITQSCSSEGTVNSYKDILYNKFLSYAMSTKLIDKSNFLSLSIIDYKKDSNTADDSTYLTKIQLICSDGSTRCLKTSIDFADANDILLFITMDKYNEVRLVETFSKRGEYYKELTEKYSTAISNYLVEKNLATKENLRLLQVDIKEHYGMYRYQGVNYWNSYAVSISYLCNDYSNTCIDSTSFGEFSNLTFDASLFMESENRVGLLATSSVFE